MDRIIDEPWIKSKQQLTYLECVQVDVIQGAVNTRCQIMRHLDTPLALLLPLSTSRIHSLALSPSNVVPPHPATLYISWLATTRTETAYEPQ